jgi:serralysin
MANPIPSTSPFGPTNDPLIDALTSGYRWILGADRTVDWAVSGGFNGEFWTAPNLVAQYAAAMLETFAAVANIRFNYVGSFGDPHAAAAAGAEINFYTSGSATTFPSNNILAAAYYPRADLGAFAGDIVLNINSEANSYPSYLPGTAGWFVFLHEIGHALGLKHPFESENGHGTLEQLGLRGLDIDWATIMAYDDDYSFNTRAYDPATPMLLDVLALQYLYGPNLSTNAGSGVYNLTANDRYTTIWDAGGHDVVSFSGSNRGWYIYLPDDPLSSLSPARVGFAVPLNEYQSDSPRSLWWLLGDIEDATGSNFDDEIYGSVLANVIRGMGGNDYLDGWTGNDTVDGGAGNDEIYGDAGDDILTDPSGTNYIRGEDGNDSIVGGAGFDDIHGNAGNDTCVSGGGDDWVVGGKDNDSLVGSSGSNLVYGNLGNDTADGGDGNDVVRGGQGNDVLRGGSGNDFISGDRDSDTITGGLGADTFHSHGDAGIDRVTDFNRAEGDKVLLLAGTTYTVNQVGGDVVVNMNGGGQLILVGVSMSSLTGDWITA